MKLAGSRLLLVAAVAGVMTAAASPAFAWVCTATDATGARFMVAGPIRPSTCNFALTKCRAKSVAPRTCQVIKSHP